MVRSLLIVTFPDARQRHSFIRRISTCNSAFHWWLVPFLMFHTLYEHSKLQVYPLVPRDFLSSSFPIRDFTTGWYSAIGLAGVISLTINRVILFSIVNVSVTYCFNRMGLLALRQTSTLLYRVFILGCPHIWLHSFCSQVSSTWIFCQGYLP